MSTTIRQVQGDEMVAIVHFLSSYSFEASPPLADRAEAEQFLLHLENVTFLAAFENDAPVACAAASQLTQNMRGGIFGMGGVWAVATHPSARRKGHARRVLSRLLTMLREQGDVFSCLYPFRESFYERMGYATLPLSRKCAVQISALLPLLSKDLGGSVEMCLVGDGFDAYRDFLRTVQKNVHGMAMFNYTDRVGAQRNRFWLAQAKANGEVVGVLLYQLKGDEVANFTMSIRRFYYTTSQGKYLLLAWIAHHANQASKVELWLPASENPETWFDDLQVEASRVHISPMGRVLDVAKMGGMRSGPGRFSARISDAMCPWNEGLWQFETVDGMLHVSPAKQADCDLPIHALSALAYGTQPPADFAFRGWGNPSPQLQATMSAMFPPMVPHVHETF